MSRSILAVDDSKTMRAMIEGTLREAGYQVTLAENGQDALDKLSALPKLDAIITDVNMPVMDGISFVKAVRAGDNHAGTPILILTTESSAERKQQGRDAGATGWIVKPFDPAGLLRTLGKVMV